MVVADGGSGFAEAVRETRPRTGAQRCTFHAFSQVKRYTTTRPKLQAGRELYLIALNLMGIKTLRQAELWVERNLDWCGFASPPREDGGPEQGGWAVWEDLRHGGRAPSCWIS